MNKASFAMALHLHQPIGNLESVIERAYKNCYLPLIGLLYEYPDIKITLHISGCLFDYFEKRHPHLLTKIKNMHKRGQIEFLGGGYYEPILIAIPHRDLLGQIKMMSDYIESKFDTKPKGIWIPERVWANWLAGPISEAGIKYGILDDTHLLRIGIPKEQMYGYFLTGTNRKKIAIFPSDKKLRYIIPFGNPSEAIGYFGDVANKQAHPLFVYGDDGEKFGEWPGTHKWVFEEKWLKNFFDELMKNKNWLKLVHFSDYLNSNPPLCEVEIPEASYDEMMEWTGGSWLNFLTKYPEANQMHKKMHYVSKKFDDALRLHREDNKLKEARRYLYKGQCNCAYWHGVFGGLYLYHLRNAIYNNLIEADKIIDELMHKKQKEWVEVKKFDFDLDKKDEVVIENKTFALYFDPQEGGVLKELDFRPLSTNLINTLSRRKELYHEKILEIINKHKGEGRGVRTIHEDIREIDPAIGQELVYDRFPRYCLRDHYFTNKNIERASLIKNSFGGLACFSEGEYKIKSDKDKLILENNCRIAEREIRLLKEIKIESETGLKIVYYIERKGSNKEEALLGVEFNITMPFLNSERYRYYSDRKTYGGLDGEGTIDGVSYFGITDSQKGLGVKFKFSDKPYKIFYFPVKTVSQSERAYELNFQCSCIFPIWKLDFAKDKSYRFEIKMLFDTP